MALFFLKTEKTENRFPRKVSSGFTLIEIMIVLVVIVTITLIAQSGKGVYERSIFLSNQAYDIALAVREAQVYAVNVRRVSSGGSFDIGYGVSFRGSDTGVTEFTLFADSNNNRRFDGSSEQVKKYTIKNRNTIKSVCVTSKNAPTVCEPKNSPFWVDVTFRRPDTEACILVSDEPHPTGAISTPVCNRSSLFLARPEVRITLEADNGNERCVRIYATGQVSVTQTCN